MVKIMYISELFFHMLTLKALTELSVTDRYGSDLKVDDIWDFRKNWKIENFSFFVETSSVTLYEHFCSYAYHWL